MRRAALPVVFGLLILAIIIAFALLLTGGAKADTGREQRLAAQLTLERARHAATVADLRARLRARARSTSYADAMAIAHVVYGVPVAGLSRLTWCESRHTPRARNRTALSGAHATGAAQILYIPGGGRASTWHTTPYAKLSPYDLVTNMLAAGYIWRRAGGSFREWADVCATRGDGG